MLWYCNSQQEGPSLTITKVHIYLAGSECNYTRKRREQFINANTVTRINSSCTVYKITTFLYHTNIKTSHKNLNLTFRAFRISTARYRLLLMLSMMPFRSFFFSWILKKSSGATLMSYHVTSAHRKWGSHGTNLVHRSFHPPQTNHSSPLLLRVTLARGNVW